MKAEFKQKIATHLNMLVHTKTIDDETFLAIFQIVSTDFDEWVEEFAEKLRKEAHEWESTDDSGLYSLGLRRVVDRLTMKDFEENLPVLEKPDTDLADVVEFKKRDDKDGKVR